MKLQKAKGRAKVLVVDDHPLVCYALAQLLNKTDAFICCGDADGVESARSAVRKLVPALVLLDLTLGEEDAFGLIREWKQMLPAMKVVVISRHDEAVFAERSLRCGADGFVTKAEPPAVILQAMGAVLAGERFVSGKLAAQVWKRINEGRGDKVARGMESLSARESQVFHLLGEGQSNKAIAQLLALSPKTVETYRDNLKRKLGLPDSASLLRYATKWCEHH